MTTSPRLVTVFGGSGFVGRYIARRMAKDGWRVRVAVRRPNEALFVRTYGTVGQVEPLGANIRDDASTRAAIAGADAVVNCVGILGQHWQQTFGAVHAEGAGRIARIAAEQGVGTLVHVSAIGADATSDSLYARSKAAGEAAALSAFPGAVILRPSIMFGPEDDFFNRFAVMAKFTPVLPLVGAATRFQPVYVDDVARAAAMAAEGQAKAGTYELGGPDVASFADLMQRMLAVVHKRRLLLPVPFWLARLKAWGFDMAQFLSMGLITNSLLTRDQVTLLRYDNIVADDARGFAALGIEPVPMDAVLDSYLYCHRESGQYTAIKDSASNLRA